MASDFLPARMDESQRQFFANSLRPRLEAELQQQVAIYSQQFGEALAYQAHRIAAEQVDAFLQKFQSIPRSPSPPPPYAAENIASKAETGTSRCRRYLFLPVPLPPTTKFISQGNLLSNFRSTPCAMLQQALSPDMIELLGRRGTSWTYLPLRDVVCPVVDKLRNFGRALRVARAFERMIRVAMKAFSHLVKDTSFGKLLERPVARFMLSLVLERECANFGATPVFVDRARLYIVRVRGLTRYLDKICHSEEGMAQFTNNLRIPTVFDTDHSGVLIRQSMSVVIYVAPIASPVASPRTVAIPALVPHIAEYELAAPKQTSTAIENKSGAAPAPLTSVPAASSMNVLQHTTPVQSAQIVPRIHAVSSQTQPIVTQATQPVGTTTRDVNTDEPPAIHKAFPQSDTMEVCIPEATRSQQVGTADSHAELSQAMDGIKTLSVSSPGLNMGQDDMDDVQVTGQPTVARPSLFS